MITYLDSHCHITSDRLYARIDEILENCHAHQVGELLVICCQHEEYLRAMQLKQQHPFIHVAYGFSSRRAQSLSCRSLVSQG